MRAYMIMIMKIREGFLIAKPPKFSHEMEVPIEYSMGKAC